MNVSVIDNPYLIPFDDTYILYDARDPISFISAYFSLLPVGVLVFYLSWFITTREMEACIIAGGQVANEIFNNIIKNIIKQPRPYSFGETFQNGTMRSGYGMPSAHSQFMGFFFVYTSLRFALRWKGLNQVKRMAGIITMGTLAFMVCFSRVYLKYHTLEQVLVGFSIGLVSGSSYFFIVGILREIGILEWVLQLGICKMLYMKDSCNLAPITLKEEYEMYLARVEPIANKSKSDVKDKTKMNKNQ
ncbi:hypothetical protein Kpol_499p8 [Vanderwaltozyma polyspora DSM 70294]|uniref:Dolichyldiphosphatase n=1 Tax=Vanderwaltozyma polyspora (strain ATCC 22028 / DSM 70294 / BCRC 21397 / CBS 2163 / NBRC 10782 / NRRL Y-8283 / UCD 57-17) TaxID=436907 RepID=A7TP11_VANPO|nr:uncharacterized protein Kpol_499p8 [Vanderwaltozyma polyspora DSM 70294]EDO15980.1 hypothetical protein Kpol_499p8 [Vanderwaltozyma polyspora DSM 70294]